MGSLNMAPTYLVHTCSTLVLAVHNTLHPLQPGPLWAGCRVHPLQPGPLWAGCCVPEHNEGEDGEGEGYQGDAHSHDADHLQRQRHLVINLQGVNTQEGTTIPTFPYLYSNIPIPLFHTSIPIFPYLYSIPLFQYSHITIPTFPYL